MEKFGASCRQEQLNLSPIQGLTQNDRANSERTWADFGERLFAGVAFGRFYDGCAATRTPSERAEALVAGIVGWCIVSHSRCWFLLAVLLNLGVVAVYHLVHDAILGSKLLEQCIVGFN